MINVYTQTLRDNIRRSSDGRVRFHRWDGGDVHTQCPADSPLDWVPGSVVIAGESATCDVRSVGRPDDQVRILVLSALSSAATGGELEADGHRWRATGYVQNAGQWQENKVAVIPLQEELYSRTQGLLETSVLADPRVLIGGLGSVGSKVSLEFASLGLHQVLVDYDRIEGGNVSRSVGSVSEIGRLKTRVMADQIHGKNPYAEVETHEFKITWDTEERLRDLVQHVDLGICALDNHESRLIWNKVFVEENRPYLMAGMFRRAYGGQILFVRPRKSLCYQCFVMGRPDIAHDREISSAEAAERYAYSDRPVEIQPGLSNDITPINQMLVKLAMQYLLKGRSASLRSLDEDLVAPWWIWLNRREAQTDYENLKPLGSEGNGCRILCWYPIARESTSFNIRQNSSRGHSGNSQDVKSHDKNCEPELSVDSVGVNGSGRCSPPAASKLAMSSSSSAMPSMPTSDKKPPRLSYPDRNP